MARFTYIRQGLTASYLHIMYKLPGASDSTRLYSRYIRPHAISVHNEQEVIKFSDQLIDRLNSMELSFTAAELTGGVRAVENLVKKVWWEMEDEQAHQTS